MIKLYLVDDDPNIVDLLSMMIEDGELGTILGHASNGAQALQEITAMRPDIVIADLLMPVMDGITLVRRAKAAVPECSFLMLTQVSSKEMVAKAYEAGVEFLIQKPLNAIEVKRVLQQVAEHQQMRQALSQMQNLISSVSPASPAAESTGSVSSSPSSVPAPREDARRTTLDRVLLRLGIAGESGSRDITALMETLWESDTSPDQITLAELCARVGQNPKSVEQRVRRAAATGMANLANLGLEDYANEVFTEYAGTLYTFEQVKKEMDFLRGRSEEHGSIFVKAFLSSLWAYCQSQTAF